PGETLGLRFGIRAPQRKNVARSLDLNSGIEACGLGDAERLGKCGSHKGKPRIERRRRLSWRGNGWWSPYDLPRPHLLARDTTLVTDAPQDRHLLLFRLLKIVGRARRVEHSAQEGRNPECRHKDRLRLLQRAELDDRAHHSYRDCECDAEDDEIRLEHG